MKLKAKVVLGKQKRDFYIPCGTGDKNFKWLALVATQRFAKAIPNGALRWRDDFCGITENVQYYCTDMELPSGDVPDPSEMINYYLRDGDEIVVILGSSQDIVSASGSPAKNRWTNSMYNRNFHEDQNTEDEKQGEEEGEEDEDEDEEEFENMTDNEIASYKMKKRNDDRVLMKSKADFMRLVLKSQMIDEKKVKRYINNEWSKIAKSIPNSSDQFNASVEEVFCKHCDILKELYEYCTKTGPFVKQVFTDFVTDCNIFPEHISEQQSNKIYSRICKFAQIDNDTNFTFECFLASLVLCAQLKYNDTFAIDSHRDPKKALEVLIEEKLLPIASAMNMKSVLKREFTSDECLSKIRDYYEALRLLYDKTSAKARDIPTTVPAAEMMEILYQTNLSDEKEPDKDFHDKDLAPTLLNAVRKGTLFGRDSYVTDDNEEISLDEFTFPEFIEVIANAGAIRYAGRSEQQILKLEQNQTAGVSAYICTALEEEQERQSADNPMTTVQCMALAVKHCMETANDKDAHRKPVEKEKGRGGFSRGGQKGVRK